MSNNQKYLFVKNILKVKIIDDHIKKLKNKMLIT